MRMIYRLLDEITVLLFCFFLVLLSSEVEFFDAQVQVPESSLFLGRHFPTWAPGC